MSAVSKNELRIDVAGRSERQVYFNVPLRVGVGSVVQVGTKKLTLTSRPVNIPVKPKQRISIMDSKVAVISRQGGRLLFPSRPYNSYSRDHKSDISMAFLRLEIPLPDGVSKAGMRILVE